MFVVNSRVEIVNHSEPRCNGQYGTVKTIDIAYDGRTRYYNVELDDSLSLCVCTDDELMEE